jgi:hypothetical protein
MIILPEGTLGFVSKFGLFNWLLKLKESRLYGTFFTSRLSTFEIKEPSF